MNEIASKKKYSAPEVNVHYIVREDILNSSGEAGCKDEQWSEWI